MMGPANSTLNRILAYGPVAGVSYVSARKITRACMNGEKADKVNRLEHAAGYIEPTGGVAV